MELIFLKIHSVNWDHADFTWYKYVDIKSNWGDKFVKTSKLKTAAIPWYLNIGCLISCE